MTDKKGDENDDPFERGKEMASSVAFGGARPKTNTRPKFKSSGNSSSARAPNAQVNITEHAPRARNISPGQRRKREFFRTNSSDSVFRVINQDSEDYEIFTGLQSRTEANPSDNWDPCINLESRESVPKIARTEPSQLNLFNGSIDVKTEEQIDHDNLETVEDDCYIYTYKGGTAYLSADLPNSFFRLDSGSDGESLPGVSGAGQSNLSTGVAALLQDQLLNIPPSPDEQDDPDFLELDFDPSSDDDLSSNDSGQGREELPNEAILPAHSPSRHLPDNFSLDLPPPELVSPRTSVSRHASLNSLRENTDLSSISPDLNLKCVSPEENEESCIKNNNNSHQSSKNIKVIDAQCLPCDISSKPKFSVETVSSTIEVKSAPITSPVDELRELTIHMPRSKSLNNNISTCLALDKSPSEDETMMSCGNRLLLREALLFRTDHCDLSDALQKLSIKNGARISPYGCQRTMIWSEKEAYKNQANQLGVSACGATSLVNVFVAMNIHMEINEVLNSVNTQLRREKSELPDYLLSRSMAGCTHLELIEGAKFASGGRVVGRFFPMHKRSFDVCVWLATWIARGCIPVATLNPQRAAVFPGCSIADAWHHQMIWGVAGKEVFLSNPLEVVTEEHLIPQLDSPSDILVRREDVLSRFTENTDLSPLMGDKVQGFHDKWCEYNVLGQTISMLRENSSVQDAENLTVTSHLRIPASYSSGITLFCDLTNEDTLSLLISAAEHPISDI